MVYIANLHEKACIPFLCLHIPNREGYTFMLLLLAEVGKPEYGSWEFYYLYLEEITDFTSTVIIILLTVSVLWQITMSLEKPNNFAMKVLKVNKNSYELLSSLEWKYFSITTTAALCTMDD